jgi:hypothetical protein
MNKYELHFLSEKENTMRKFFALILVSISLLILVPPRATNAIFSEDTEDTFTIIWLADTQDMAYHNYDHAMQKMGKWIIDQKGPLDIRYIVQPGDMVDNGASPRQWERFDEMYNQFKDEIPYISAAGNHDVKKNGYLEYSIRPEVLAIPQENKYKDAQSLYQKFEANGFNFIIVALGYEVEPGAVLWANDVLKAHPDHIAILLIHDYLQSGGRFRINGKAMFNQVVVPNHNVRLVLCGHVKGVSSRIDAIDDDNDGIADRTVAQLMYNYQHFEDKCGQIRTMQFNTTDRSITVTTYSPVTKRYYRDYMFGDQFTFTLEDAF